MSTTVEITEDVTSVDISENITSVNITPTVTTVEVRGISIATANASGISTHHLEGGWLTGVSVQTTFDQLNNARAQIDADTGNSRRYNINTETLTFSGNGSLFTEIKDTDPTPTLHISLCSQIAAGEYDSASSYNPLTLNEYGLVSQVGAATPFQLRKAQITGLESTLSSLSAAIAASISSEDVRLDSLSARVVTNESGIITASSNASAAGAALKADLLSRAASVSSTAALKSISVSSKALVARNNLSSTLSAEIVSAANSVSSTAASSLSGEVVTLNTRADSISSTAATGRTTLSSNLTTDIGTRGDSVSSNAATARTTLSSNLTTDIGTRGDSVSANLTAVTTSITNRQNTASSLGIIALSTKLDKTGGNISGDLFIGGDLRVTGSTTTVTSQTLNVSDKNITLSASAVQASDSNSAGLTVYRGTAAAAATFTWQESNSAWTLSNKFKVDTILDSTGGVGSADQVLSVSSDGTTKWASAVTDLTGVNSRIDTVSSAVSATASARDSLSAQLTTDFNARGDSVSSNAATGRTTLSSNLTTDIGTRGDSVSSNAVTANQALSTRIDTNSTTLAAETVRINSLSSDFSGFTSYTDAARVNSISTTLAAETVRINSLSSDLATKINYTDWTIEQSGTNLLFKYNSEEKLRLSNSGILGVKSTEALDNVGPSFTSPQIVSVVENTAAGTDILALTATDSGPESDGTVTFSATHASFQVDASNNLQIDFSPNFETANSYTVPVVATDSVGNTTTQNIAVTITDVDESPSYDATFYLRTAQVGDAEPWFGFIHDGDGDGKGGQLSTDPSYAPTAPPPTAGLNDASNRALVYGVNITDCYYNSDNGKFIFGLNYQSPGYVPVPDENLTITFTKGVSSSDGSGGTSAGTLTTGNPGYGASYVGTSSVQWTWPSSEVSTTVSNAFNNSTGDLFKVVVTET